MPVNCVDIFCTGGQNSPTKWLSARLAKRWHAGAVLAHETVAFLQKKGKVSAFAGSGSIAVLEFLAKVAAVRIWGYGLLSYFCALNCLPKKSA